MQIGLGRQRYQEVRNRILNRQPLKKAIWEMNLQECLEAKEKYLKWIVGKNEKDYAVANKIHMYEKYLLPRIEMLENGGQLEADVKEFVI